MILYYKNYNIIKLSHMSFKKVSLKEIEKWAFKIPKEYMFYEVDNKIIEIDNDGSILLHMKVEYDEEKADKLLEIAEKYEGKPDVSSREGEWKEYYYKSDLIELINTNFEENETRLQLYCPKEEIFNDFVKCNVESEEDMRKFIILHSPENLNDTDVD